MEHPTCLFQMKPYRSEQTPARNSDEPVILSASVDTAHTQMVHLHTRAVHLVRCSLHSVRPCCMAPHGTARYLTYLPCLLATRARRNLDW